MTRKSAANFETLWNAMPYPALTLDGEDRVTAFNAAAEQFFAVSARSRIGKVFSDIASPGSRLAAVIATSREGGVSLAEHGIELSWGDRASRLVDLQVAPLNDMPKNQTVLLVLQPRGIAEKMSRSLAHLSAARSVSGMASALAHEIKNPLAAIYGAAQLLSMSASDQEMEMTDLIQEETNRIRRLLDRMEHFTDSRPPVRRPVNIHDVLDLTRRGAAAGFGSGLRFIQEYDPSLPPTPGDRDQLAQAVQNLLKNAAEAVGEGGTITLRTAYRPGVRIAGGNGRGRQSLPLEVAIIDNGPGVPEELAPYLYEPFVTSKATGTGLGLALVSKIVADHGGVLEYDRAAGKTIFRILLPVWSADQDEAEA